jgi:hypothetical protein
MLFRRIALGTLVWRDSWLKLFVYGLTQLASGPLVMCVKTS